MNIVKESGRPSSGVPPQVVAIHDLSCYGRSSLGVVMPTLSAMGAYVTPLPTALLSTQTDGFENYHYKDLTSDMQATVNHWQGLDLQVQGVYSGFLGSPAQSKLVLRLFDMYPEALRVVDPVMGDHGTLYGPMTSSFVASLGHLVKKAHVITPNMTEAALLLKRPFPKTITLQEAGQWVRDLQQMGPQGVVITSVPLAEYSGQCCTLFADGSEPVQVVSTPEIMTQATLPNTSEAQPHTPEAQPHTPEAQPLSLPGTGDIFASVVMGSLLQGRGLSFAVHQAVDFITRCIEVTCKAGTPRREGPLLESCLGLLLQG